MFFKMVLSSMSVTNLAIKRGKKKKKTTSFCWHLTAKSVTEMDGMTIMKMESNLVDQNEKSRT